MSRVVVEVEAVDDAEPRPKRRDVSRPARVVAPIERELLQPAPSPTARWVLADHDVELVILHRRIQDLFDRRAPDDESRR